MTDFFSAIAPDLYDLSMPAVVPGLAEARRIRADVWRSTFGMQKGWRGADLGIGTGSDAATLMPSESVGTLFGFDGSERLTRDIHRTHRLPGGMHPDLDVRLVPMDLGVIDRPKEAPADGSCDFVNSAFAIHNIHHEAQARAFDLVGRLLRPGGIFLYLDLVGYDDERMETLAHRFDLDFIRTEMAEAPTGVPVKAWHGLRDQWLEHYEKENFLIPLASAAVRPNLHILFESAGLTAPAVLYRLLHTTLVVATKI